MRRWLPVALLTVCSAVSAPTETLKREGDWWVYTQSGPVPTSASLVATVQTRGPVRVRGGRSASDYTLTTRLRARTEAEARLLLARLHLKTSSLLQVKLGDRALTGVEVQLITPPETAVSVDTWNGDIDIAGVRSAVARTSAGLIRIDQIRGEASARTAGGEIRIGRVTEGVRCFSGGGTIQAQRVGGESWFETAGGNINIGEAYGVLHCYTGGGNIRIGRAISSVMVRSAGGRIEVSEAGGPVMAGNLGGSIQVGAAQGVRLEATGGSIRLRGSSGTLRAASDAGSILAELVSGVRLQDSALMTGAGDITVFIPSNLALTIKALNDSRQLGRIVSEFPEILIRQMQEESRMLAEGALNGGGPTLQLISGGGTIYLRRTR